MLLISIVSDAEAVFPATSEARTCKICEPLLAVIVSHGAMYGELRIPKPRAVPSSVNCTRGTPLKPEVAAAMLIVPDTAAPEAGDVIDTLACVLLPLEIFTLTALGILRAPVVSNATALSVYLPLLLFVVSHATE
jgi:hypothetical protein